MGDDQKIYLHDCDECHEPIKDRRILCGACIRPWAEPGSHWVCSECVALLDEVFRRGCIVGAAIVAWGDAMRARPGMTAWRCLVCETSNPDGSTVCDDCGAEWT